MEYDADKKALSICGKEVIPLKLFTKCSVNLGMPKHICMELCQSILFQCCWGNHSDSAREAQFGRLFTHLYWGKNQEYLCRGLLGNIMFSSVLVIVLDLFIIKYLPRVLPSVPHRTVPWNNCNHFLFY